MNLCAFSPTVLVESIEHSHIVLCMYKCQVNFCAFPTSSFTHYTVLQSKRANFAVFKIFCYFQESLQEGSTLSLWEDTTNTCTALLEVTCCHVV